MSTAAIPTKRKVDAKYIIHCMIYFLFLFGFQLLPAPDPITPMGMKVIGCFLSMLWGWTFIDLIWTSLLTLTVFALSGYMPFNQAMMNGFGHNFTIMAMFMGILFGFVSQSGLSRKIALFILTRKISEGRPWVLTMMIFVATYAVSMVTSLFPSIIIMWAIYNEFNDLVGYNPRDKYPIAVVLGIVYVAILSSTVLPIWPIALLMIGGLESATGVSVNLLSYTVTFLILSILGTIMYFLAMKYIIRPDIQPLVEGQNRVIENFHPEPLNKFEKIALITIISYFVCLFIPYLLPKGNFIRTILQTLGTAGLMIVAIAILMAVHVDGKPTISFEGLAKTNMMWTVFMMFAATMPISAALEDEQTGVMSFILDKMTPLFGGLNPVLFSILVAIFFCTLTQFMHNVVLAAIAAPLYYTFCTQLGANPGITMVLCCYGINLAILTPAASGMSALFFSNSRYVEPKEGYKYTFLAYIISCVTIILGYPIANIFF
jgi:sodium-dependent dicarboxylate transporter 2/3/5